MKAKHVENIEK
jgi:hypothetical protein